MMSMGTIDILMEASAEHLRAGRWSEASNSLGLVNEDCENGDTRPLNPAAAPFHVAARPVLAFSRKVAFLAEEQG
jgi:hypothetical protein